ncbi:MAG: hypothetical protein D6693_05395 [Planctomycetota bacterium]|nr:MAG: hypothetical protein D6693_05395 [Planctomycetota bacterium]
MDDARETFDLSPEGARRRDAMREALVAHAAARFERRRRRRRARRAGALVVTLAGGAWLTATLTQPGGRVGGHGPTGPTAGGAPGPALITVTVDRTLVDPATVAISDDELLETLNAMGRPTGLARIGGRVVLTDNVTDDTIGSRAM